jgi:hypothetical protein
MTPDMKRLYEAADKAGSLEWHVAVLPEDRTAIIRAVLLALREPSYEMIRAADDTATDGGDGRMVRGDFEREVAAMIDYILTEPTMA